MKRIPNDPEYIHEQLGEKFARALSPYDTRRRVEILVDYFLKDEMIKKKQAVDVGCGLGFFSKRLQERGAEVTACDIGPGLVEQTRQLVGCQGEVADALSLIDHFGLNRFDLVVSSECIEHTPNPQEAIRQMAGILKPGGFLSVSTPNFRWYPLVKFATDFKLRPFEGYENFSSWKGIRKTIVESGLEVHSEYGLHLFPFQLGLKNLSTWCDKRFQQFRELMINICILAQKPRNSASSRIFDVSI